MTKDIQQIQEKILPILKEAGVLRSSIFGSTARGEATTESDVDILVETPGHYGLFKFLGIKADLEDALGKKVDLIEFQAIKPALKENILKDQVVIF